MTCKLSGLFSIGEDFEDEDLLETDWASCSVSGPADVAAAVSSCALRASSVAHSEPEKIRLQQTGERSAAPCNGSASESSTHTAATGQTVALGLRQLSSSSQLHSPLPPPPPSTLNNSDPNRATQQSHGHAKGLPKPCVAQDDFDDWDVDLADLEECDGQIGQLPQPPAPRAPIVEPPAKKLRSSTYGGIQTLPEQTMRELSAARKTSSSSGQNLAPFPPVQPPNPRPAFPLAPPQRSGVFPGFTATSPVPTSFSRTLEQRACSTPRPSPQARSLFETVSSAPSSSPSVSPHPLHTPVLTNRLVQLVSASNKLPKKRPRSEPHQPRTRRFPGPAGLLPQQPQGQNLDEVVVSAPQTPAHGAVARLPSQGSSSQTEEDEFGGGAWAAMKAEMGLDERNPSCFLHSYSVVMVLRKLCVKGHPCEVVLSGSRLEFLHVLVSAVCACHRLHLRGAQSVAGTLAKLVQAALKQLARNKVPNMAVLLKSIVHTHTDAKAVFKDPTGEMQGTIHRRLLEDRVEELKVGAVLLLKQVGVFSPSHRNHYLNVTSNNLLRIYAPGGVSLASTQLPPLVLDLMLLSPAESPAVLREPVSCMQLMFDEEDDEGKDGERRTEGDPQAPADSYSRGSPERAGNPAPQDPGWDADDDLDELLGELPEDACSL